mmetsp:Transcript_607/g.1615  ORF Transcript_607/g.1615 Transcript_607/m.1615 type:complete len:331 (+) Transcript_607:1824-2816(+)
MIRHVAAHEVAFLGALQVGRRFTLDKRMDPRGHLEPQGVQIADHAHRIRKLFGIKPKVAIAHLPAVVDLHHGPRQAPIRDLLGVRQHLLLRHPRLITRPSRPDRVSKHRSVGNLLGRRHRPQRHPARLCRIVRHAHRHAHREHAVVVDVVIMLPMLQRMLHRRVHVVAPRLDAQESVLPGPRNLAVALGQRQELPGRVLNPNAPFPLEQVLHPLVLRTQYLIWRVHPDVKVLLRRIHRHQQPPACHPVGTKQIIHPVRTVIERIPRTHLQRRIVQRPYLSNKVSTPEPVPGPLQPNRNLCPRRFLCKITRNLVLHHESPLHVPRPSRRRR